MNMLLRKKGEHENKQLSFNFPAINPKNIF